MNVTLTVVGGMHDGRVIPVKGPEFLIGRDANCHLKATSPAISRNHCAFLIRDNQVFLRDYGSRNGTVLNRRVLLKGELQLEDGDVIEAGPLTFRLGISGQSAAVPAGVTGEKPQGQDARDTVDVLKCIADEHEIKTDETTAMSGFDLQLDGASQDDAPEILTQDEG